MQEITEKEFHDHLSDIQEANPDTDYFSYEFPYAFNEYSLNHALKSLREEWPEYAIVSITRVFPGVRPYGNLGFVLTKQ